MAVPGIWSEPLAPSRSSWPAASETKTKRDDGQGREADGPQDHDGKEHAEAHEHGPFGTVEDRGPHGQLDGVHSRGGTESRREAAEGEADRPRRPRGGGRDCYDPERPARLVGTQEESLQPDEENGRRSPRDVGLAALPRRGPDAERAAVAAPIGRCPATRSGTRPSPTGRSAAPSRLPGSASARRRALHLTSMEHRPRVCQRKLKIPSPGRGVAG